MIDKILNLLDIVKLVLLRKKTLALDCPLWSSVKKVNRSYQLSVSSLRSANEELSADKENLVGACSR